MSTDPDQIRREIEATRSSLSSDVDALAYKVSPAASSTTVSSGYAARCRM